jgi:transketolase
MVFLTGDLGFMALEPLQAAMGARFINCGVAEQNMISVAAALSHEGMETWTYTIAAFCYARAFEQIRNDVCLHGLPVKLLANGGGYGYGVMGPTHHALEDYGILLTLPKMTVFVPAFTEDVGQTVSSAADLAGPAYIRLGRGEKPANQLVPEYAPWRLLLEGEGGVMIAVGPLAGSAWGALLELDPRERPALWVVTELPIGVNRPPAALIATLKRTRRLAVVEEHVEQGSVGQQICRWAMETEVTVDRFRHLTALGYPSGTYGSQAFLRRCSALDPQSIAQEARALAS